MTERKLNRARLEALLRARTEADLADGRVGGCAMMVRQDGEVVTEAVFGERIPGEGVPMTADTIFRMASMTKPVTAVAVLMQVARGKIGLDDPVADYLPAYAHMHTGALQNGEIMTGPEIPHPVRVRHLLTHSSGIGSMELGDVVFSKMAPADRRTLADAVAYYAAQPLAFAPGSAQAYSPVAAFDVLAHLVELTADEPYDAFLARELFAPLGMTDTGFAPTDAQWARMAGLHNRTAEGKSVTDHGMDHFIFGDFPLTYFCGGAGLYSTLADYASFAEMLLREGKTPEGKTLLPAGWIRDMRTPQLPANVMSGDQVWGLGVRVIQGEHYCRLPHGAYGWSGAYGTHFWVDPTDRVTAVYMKNSAYDGGAGATTANHFEEDVEAAFL